MPAKNEDLHGSAPDKCETALLLIDVINDLAFPEGEQMLPDARKMAEKILALKQRAREAGVPAIYVNDNFGNGSRTSAPPSIIVSRRSHAGANSLRRCGRTMTTTSC
jgi:nicotinamidase-related amidase